MYTYVCICIYHIYISIQHKTWSAAAQTILGRWYIVPILCQNRRRNPLLYCSFCFNESIWLATFQQMHETSRTTIWGLSRSGSHEQSPEPLRALQCHECTLFFMFLCLGVPEAAATQKLLGVCHFLVYVFFCSLLHGSGLPPKSVFPAHVIVHALRISLSTSRNFLLFAIRQKKLPQSESLACKWLCIFDTGTGHFSKISFYSMGF